MSRAETALDWLLAEDTPWRGRDGDGRPMECCYCPFAGESDEVNTADPGEGYYRCLLLGDEEVSNRQSRPLRRGWVWGESPLCTPTDWRSKAREELASER